EAAAGLIFANHFEFGFRGCLGKEVVDASFGRDGGRGERIVAGDHHGFYAHAAQLGEALLDAAFDDVFEIDDAERAIFFGDDEWSAAAFGDVFDGAADIAVHVAAMAADELINGVGGPFADFAAVEIDAAEAGLRGEGNKPGAQVMNVAATE